ncbi:MAG: TonB C-terminal domain-containing protein [Betaproteobacteria bacterium]|nr:TonB C-terminal domain-containing protein [Betaproteobacteria bacterium]
MRAPRLYEPDLIVSAVQATVAMAALVLPLALSIELKRTIIPVSIAVPMITEIQPQPQPQPAREISELREQARQSQNQREADLARRRQEAAEREQQQEQQRQEAEQQRQEEERRAQQQAEQERAEKERAEQDAREERRQAEQRRQREVAEQQRREAAAAAKARPGLTAEQRASLIGRYTSGIKERVHRYMSNPDGISAENDIAVEVRVRLDSRGMLVATPQIERSSGLAVYDNQALRAVIRAAAGGFVLPDDPELRNEFGDLLLTIRPKK